MPESHLDCETLVVGAGPTGLSLAIALAVHGVSVRIVDADPAPHRQARACAMHARSLELLAPYGVADRIAAMAQPIQAYFFAGPDGKELVRRTLGTLDSPYPPTQNIPQHRTESLLVDALAGRGVRVERGARFVAASQDPHGVSVELASAAGPVGLRARFLVGCDGGRSAVRPAAGIRLAGGDYPERWIASEIRTREVRRRTDTPVVFGADRVAVLQPLDHGQLFFATLRDGELPGVTHGEIPAEAVPPIYADALAAHPGIREDITDIPWSGVFSMHHCEAPDYRRGRIFLAGDAAHLCSAAGGHGMNAGIQDAVNLAWRLAARLRLGAGEAILDGYSLDRHEAFAFVNAHSDEGHRLLVAHDPDVFAAAGRNRLRGVLGRFFGPSAGEKAAEAYDDRKLGETCIAYTRDPLLEDRPATGRLRAGMRVPLTADLTMGFGTPRPFSMLLDGFTWTLLVAVPTRDGLTADQIAELDASAAGRLGGRVRTVVASGDAFAWNAPRPTLYLIRPDGHVAFRSDRDPGGVPDSGPLIAWFDRAFPR